MKNVLRVASLILISVVATAQCGPIIDEASILHDNAAIQTAAATLVDEGADVKVVTVAQISRYGVNLLAVESSYEARCPSWLSPAGQRKANLLVFMVAPNDRKKNIFFGAAYRGPFPDEVSVNTMYSRAANPYFSNHEWEQGLAAAMKDFAARIGAYHDQSQHPAQNTINEPAPDMRGLWTFLMWVLGVGAVGGAGFVLWMLTTRRKKERDEIATAQTEAIAERSTAAAAYVAISKDHPQYFSISAEFKALSESSHVDPNENGLTAAQYRAIGGKWLELRQRITGQAPPISPQPEPVQGKNWDLTDRERHSLAPQPQPQPQPQTTIIQTGSGSDGFLEGILIADALQNRGPYTLPAPDPIPVSSSPSGSDSSWSSSDSGSDSSWNSGDSGGAGSDSSGGGGGSDSSF
jgi:uncharacterized membrane protein YgcG